MPIVILRPGRERSLNRRHPWIFSGGVAHVAGDPTPGQTVLVRYGDGPKGLMAAEILPEGGGPFQSQ